LDSSVYGTVTLDGAPLHRGTVTFHPEKTGAVAYGRILADGSYSISTGSRGGLSAGEYFVTVVATAGEADPTKEAAGKLLTPTRYGRVDQSALRSTVRPGRNKIDLALKSKG
jgi:hypothetical protein